MTSRSGYACSRCGFSLWLPVAELRVSSLGLYDDDRYPGRCLLVLNEHFEDFSQLPSSLIEDFVADLQRAAQAITRVVGAERMNYALLGNVEPHVHFHLIPRTPIGDPAPGQSPWSTTIRKASLDPSRRNELIKAIGQELLRRSR